MADLIDRDAVLHDVSTECSNAYEAKYYDAQVALTRAKRIICDAPAVNRWIPCSERLPENRIGIIFTVYRWHPFVCVGYRINSEREGLKLQRWFDKLSGLNFSDYDVKAWMPMPDAYKPPESEAQHEST